MNRWKDADGNPDWDAYAAEGDEIAEAENDEVIGIAVKNGQAVGVAVRRTTFATQNLGDGRSISRSYGGCATCDGGGCRDCT